MASLPQKIKRLENMSEDLSRENSTRLHFPKTYQTVKHNPQSTEVVAQVPQGISLPLEVFHTNRYGDTVTKL